MSSPALSGKDHFDRNKKESNTEYPLQSHVRQACGDLRTKKATDEKSKTNQSGSSEINVSLPVVSPDRQDANGGGMYTCPPLFRLFYVVLDFLRKRVGL